MKSFIFAFVLFSQMSFAETGFELRWGRNNQMDAKQLSLFDEGSLQFGSLCLTGDQKIAADAITKLVFKNSQIKVEAKIMDSKEIRFLWTAPECVESHGQYDAYECDKYEQRNKVAFIMDCALGL